MLSTMLEIYEMRDRVIDFLINEGYNIVDWKISQPFDSGESTKVNIHAMTFTNKSRIRVPDYIGIKIKEEGLVPTGTKFNIHKPANISLITPNNQRAHGEDIKELSDIDYYLFNHFPTGQDLIDQYITENEKLDEKEEMNRKIQELIDHVDSCVLERDIENLIQETVNNLKSKSITRVIYPGLITRISQNLIVGVQRVMTRDFHRLMEGEASFIREKTSWKDQRTHSVSWKGRGSFYHQWKGNRDFHQSWNSTTEI